MTYSGSGFILLTSDFKVLIVQDAKTKKWGFPKGHREESDTSDLITAQRELEEETGIHPDSYKIHDQVFRITRGSSSYTFRYGFAKPNVSGRIQNRWEISAIRWVPLTEFLIPSSEYATTGNKYLRTWIEDVCKSAPKKAVHILNDLLLSKTTDSIVSSVSSCVTSS